MMKSFFMVSFLLSQLLFSQPVFAQYPMAYDYLMELGLENLDCGDYQEALHFFKKARIINPAAKEPKRYTRFIKDILEKEKIGESGKDRKIVRVADLYKWERGLEKRLQEFTARHKSLIDALGRQAEFFLKQSQAFTLELSKSREIIQGLREEIVSLENKIEELNARRREDRINFSMQLKEEIADAGQRYDQRLRDAQYKLERANLEQEKLYKRMEEMIVKIEEERLKIFREKVKREAEETALDRYERKIKRGKRGEGN